jgi:hypothetical protein
MDDRKWFLHVIKKSPSPDGKGDLDEQPAFLIVRTSDLPFYIFLLQGLTFVVMMLSPCQGDRQLCKPFFIDEEESGYNGETSFLYLGLQFTEFPFGEQQLAVTLRLMIVVCTVSVFGNVHVDHEKFVPLEGAIGINNAGFPLTDRLDLRSGKLNAGRKIL